MLYLSGIMKESTHQHRAQFEWAVIGAGPAGMATIGRLLDAGVISRQGTALDRGAIFERLTPLAEFAERPESISRLQLLFDGR